MKTKEARNLGKRVAKFVNNNQFSEAHSLLSPVLASRTPFRLLDLIGEAIGDGPLSVVNAFLQEIASDKTEGGWVVIASALRQQLDRDCAGAFIRSRDFIVFADIWYAADIFGERVPGPALVLDFHEVLSMLSPWREDTNRWVRRTVGVTAHFWAKRSRDTNELDKVKILLSFLEPMFEEWDLDAVKGVGWGLKTLGRYFPELVAEWLAEQIIHRKRSYRALMVRKALTYLSENQRARATGG